METTYFYGYVEYSNQEAYDALSEMLSEFDLDSDVEEGSIDFYVEDLFSHEKVLDVFAKAGNLVAAEVDVSDHSYGDETGNDTHVRYIWDVQNKTWEKSTGYLCYGADEAEAKFGKSKAHKAVENILVSFVNREAARDRDRCREDLIAAGCSEELVKELGLAHLFED